MSARAFKATRTVRPRERLLGDWVADIARPFARVLRLRDGCNGCNRRRWWLNRVHLEMRDYLRRLMK